MSYFINKIDVWILYLGVLFLSICSILLGINIVISALNNNNLSFLSFIIHFFLGWLFGSIGFTLFFEYYTLLIKGLSKNKMILYNNSYTRYCDVCGIELNKHNIAKIKIGRLIKFKYGTMIVYIDTCKRCEKQKIKRGY